MRIWSLHPKYLDTKGLVALWRETLLAKHVLEGRTKGYKHHPQLNRFKKAKEPVDAINTYLIGIYHEACKRNYHFNKEKIDWDTRHVKLKVTNGQLAFERKHLLNKLKERDMEKYRQLNATKLTDTHDMFRVVEGEREEWEILI